MSTLRDDLEARLARYEELEKLLVDEEVLAHPARLASVAREHGSLARVANKYRRFKQLNEQVAEAVAMTRGNDPELRELAEHELPELRRQREDVFSELLDLTIGGEDASRNRCVLEIRAGTGGHEAALFARDLFEMYRRYVEGRGWKFEVLLVHPSELGGFKEVIVGLEGEGVYQAMRYESGGHRVQRVPQTEAKGRIHTSLATAAVLPEPEDVEIDLKPDHYRLDLFSASGPGGQHVNKTQSAVRLTHYETGIVVSCQDEKSQHKNKAKALRVLKSRLFEHRRSRQHAQRAQERKSMVGSGDRSQKIRTYNFPENRITDHRINLTLYNLDAVMGGNLAPLTQALIDHDRRELRGAMGTID